MVRVSTTKITLTNVIKINKHNNVYYNREISTIIPTYISGQISQH